MKKITAGILAIALSGSLYAGNVSEGRKFIGLEVSQTDIQADWVGSPTPPYYEIGAESDAVQFGLRLGAENDKYRTMLLYTYYDDSDREQNIQTGMLSVDYFIWNTDVQGMKLKPFIGINTGYMNYESNDPYDQLNNIDESDFFYGGQAGLILNIGEVFEVDLSYRYSLSNLDEVDHMGNIVLGLNYLY
jgi:opacity protein-like surface antigen